MHLLGVSNAFVKKIAYWNHNSNLIFVYTLNLAPCLHLKWNVDHKIQKSDCTLWFGFSSGFVEKCLDSKALLNHTRHKFFPVPIIFKPSNIVFWF